MFQKQHSLVEKELPSLISHLGSEMFQEFVVVLSLECIGVNLLEHSDQDHNEEI